MLHKQHIFFQNIGHWKENLSALEVLGSKIKAFTAI
jgi:hypothetical protein